MNHAISRLMVGVMALGVVIATSGKARAQELSFGDDWLKIEDATGKQQTLLELATLWLGGPAGNGIDGSIVLFDADSNTILNADADTRSVSVQLELSVLNPLSSPTILLDGVGAGITAGGPGTDGDITLKDDANLDTIQLDGDTGTATTVLEGNGFVKGWARIALNGTVISCYNCDPDPLKTTRPALGTYYVDFSPLADDVRERPRMAIPDKFGGSIAGFPGITVQSDNSDPSRIRVNVGPAEDHSFTVLVF